MKKLLLSLFVLLFGLIGFGYCDTGYNLFTFNSFSNISDFTVVGGTAYNFSCDGLCCFNKKSGMFEVNLYPLGYVNNSNRIQLNSSTPNYCVSSGDYVFYLSVSNSSYSSVIQGYNFNNYSFNFSCPECQECQSCPSTGEILSGYILESDITQSYCEVEFGLITPENCPSYGSGEGTGDIMWSSFYVNDEQILGGANIYLTIPDYLKWDYIYVDQDLEIDVENEGDEEYIQGIIDINSYRPTSEDFTDIFVSGLTLIMPYIVIILFIVFVWKLIKRIFK